MGKVDKGLKHNTYKMRKSDRQVTDPAIIKAMLEICPICTLALQDESYPYIVPVNFGFTWDEKLAI